MLPDGIAATADLAKVIGKYDSHKSQDVVPLARRDVLAIREDCGQGCRSGGIPFNPSRCSRILAARTTSRRGMVGAERLAI
jgi:hypothetical protein